MKLIEQLTEGMGNNYQIYMDMDGCLCDFDSRFEHYTGLQPNDWKKKAEQEYGEKIATEKFWDIISHQVGKRYWAGMSWMPEGRELWDYVKKYNPYILTAPSLHDSSIEGKKMWVKQNLGNYRIVFSPAKEKLNNSGPNKILIDDSESNISDWKSRNGIGILYKGNTESVIKQLQQYGI